jgi:cytochrome c oxidase assembly protein subunit 15
MPIKETSGASVRTAGILWKTRSRPIMKSRKFAAFARFFVAYLVGVILFGAWVRITGSGNGCGSHWPACNGDIIPQAPAVKTIIEYTHRLMSGLCGIIAVALVVWARRVSRPVFRASLLALFFLVVESLLGALLVKRHLVVDDVSVARAYTVALHLANTLLLTASAALVAWRATSLQGRSNVFPAAPAATRILLGVALVAVLLTSMSGAVTALGDTVFPTQPAMDGTLLAKIRSDTSPSQHFLVRLRVIHPIMAVLAALLVAGVLIKTVARRSNSGTANARLATFALGAVVCQTGLGVFNVLLAAPGWMQIVHLLMAQAVWILTWLVFLSNGTSPMREPAEDAIGLSERLA